MSCWDAADVWDHITRRPRVSFGVEPWFKNRGPQFGVRVPSQKPKQATPWLPESAEVQPMLAEEVAERLQLIRSGATLYKAPWALIARAAGVDQETVRRAAHGEMGDHAQRRIGDVLRRLDACELRFERHGNYWREVEPPPVEGLPRQRRIVKVREFTPWAPCECCRGRDWTPVVLIDKAPGYVCRRCVPADQLPAFGARLRKL